MPFSTHRYRQASAGVCGHEGADLGAFDAARLVQVQRDIGEARRALDVLAAQVAGEIQSRAEADPGPGGIARRVGYRNAKQFIADTLGASAGEAARLTNVGKALAIADAAASHRGDGGTAGGGLADAGLADAGAVGQGALPTAPRGWTHVAAAVREGSLTVEKAEILTTTLDRLSAGEEAERQFVALARRLRPYDLRRVCAREVVLGDPDSAEAKERRLYLQRELTLTERMDGMTVVQGLLDPASAGHLRAWLDAQVRAGFQAQREAPGADRTAEQMRVDALATLAHHAMGCTEPGSGVKTTLVVRTTVEELKAGLGTATCDSLATPISVGTLRLMAVDAQVLPMVMGGKSVPLDVGYTQRCATPYQRLAVAERDGGCARCHAPVSFCDVHHILSWQFAGKTDLDNLVMLCVSCHHSVHFGGWRIEVDDDVVWFTPPEQIDPERKRRKGGLADLALAA